MKYLISFLLILVTISCNSPNESQGPLYSLETEPIIKGVYISSRYDPTIIGQIGIPNDNPGPINEVNNYGIYENSNLSLKTIGLPTSIYLNNPYPNPFENLATISYSLTEKAYVKCWIVKGRPEINIGVDNPFYSNSVLATGNIGSGQLLLIEKEQAVGNYEVQVDVGTFGKGVARVYLQVNNYLLWRNIFIVPDESKNW